MRDAGRDDAIQGRAISPLARESAPVRVDVEPPVVSGDTVVFRWTQSEPNPFQRVNEFRFRYEGIDLAAFAPLLFYEIFLGLQLRVFAAYRRPVAVVFPEPLPDPTVAFWHAFHDADLVAVSPVAGVGSYAPWASVPASIGRGRTAGVFFGGGKDSTLSACLLSELYGADEVLLIQYVAPLQRGAALADRLERRQEESMLRPARERLGVATQRVWTDFQAQFRREGYGARPHLELYTLGALPVLLAWNLSLCAFCHAWTDFPIRRLRNGRVWFHHEQSRPEMLATQSTHYRSVLGVDLTVTNVNLPFSGLTAFRVLAKRYPWAFARIVPCTLGEVGERWCYRCRKCAWYPLFGLHCGIVDPCFDYDRLFRDSPHLWRMIDYGTSGVELGLHGNAPSHPSFGEDYVFPMFCHVVAGADRNLIAGHLGREAYGNLITLKALYGNRSFPGFELMPTRAIALVDLDVARRVARLAADHLQPAADLPHHTVGNEGDVEYDFGIRMPTRTELLDHIRSQRSVRRAW
jgi:hypothetical protein